MRRTVEPVTAIRARYASACFTSSCGLRLTWRWRPICASGVTFVFPGSGCCCWPGCASAAPCATTPTDAQIKNAQPTERIRISALQPRCCAELYDERIQASTTRSLLIRRKMVQGALAGAPTPPTPTLAPRQRNHSTDTSCKVHAAHSHDPRPRASGNPTSAGGAHFCRANVTGMTIVAPPPSGGANVALWTRRTTQFTTSSPSPAPPLGVAEATSPLGPILAVMRTEPCKSGLLARPLL